MNVMMIIIIISIIMVMMMMMIKIIEMMMIKMMMMISITLATTAYLFHHLAMLQLSDHLKNQRNDTDMFKCCLYFMVFLCYFNVQRLFCAFTDFFKVLLVSLFSQGVSPFWFYPNIRPSQKPVTYTFFLPGYGQWTPEQKIAQEVGTPAQELNL